MVSLGFIGPGKILGSPLNLAPPPKKKNLIFCSGPSNYFGLKFLAPPPLKLGGLLPCPIHKKGHKGKNEKNPG